MAFKPLLPHFDPFGRVLGAKVFVRRGPVAVPGAKRRVARPRLAVWHLPIAQPGGRALADDALAAAAPAGADDGVLTAGQGDVFAGH